MPTRFHHHVRVQPVIGLSMTIAFCSALSASAQDVPAPAQPVGVHSTISFSDGSYIRDDQLADYVAERIAHYGGQVKDVKIIAAGCFGGGLLDDFERALGSIPWVGAAGASGNEQSWHACDICAGGDPAQAPKNLGSSFVSALAGPASGDLNPDPGSMRDGASNNVMADMNAAAANDESGPNGSGQEHPVVASGNGGSNIQWHEAGTSHLVVLFGGDMSGDNDTRAFENDMTNMADSLIAAQDGNGSYQQIENGTKQELIDAIDIACDGLDANTQLVLFFTGHGDTHFDLKEYCEHYGLPWPPIVFDNLWDLVFNLHDGWNAGFFSMVNQPGREPEPVLEINLVEPILGEEWVIEFNGVVLPLPPGLLAGPISVPVPWQNVSPIDNTLAIFPAAPPPSGPFNADFMQLSSGRIAGAVWTMSTPGIPAASHWGALVLGLLLCAGASVLLRRRREQIRFSKPDAGRMG